ncbi:hypothetical protein AVEN_266262-1 [Araneus ventricosus]|uniref:Uncharacterized protein n=1 Tax=Araneus ventricosus TaxID=182803 RepID=A0A4Y2G3A7_ARAVE|nr:hypothetical protein AVEN_266262-1 [Araneus ventricosus]
MGTCPTFSILVTPFTLAMPKCITFGKQKQDVVFFPRYSHLLHQYGYLLRCREKKDALCTERSAHFRPLPINRLVRNLIQPYYFDIKATYQIFIYLAYRVFELSCSFTAEVPNLWYAYPWGYAKVILVMARNTKRKHILEFDFLKLV